MTTAGKRRRGRPILGSLGERRRAFEREERLQERRKKQQAERRAERWCQRWCQRWF